MGWYQNCMGFFLLRVAPILIFKTRKFVVIKDWKLGVLLRLIQAAVLGYVIWDIFNKEGYLVTEIPQGAVAVYSEGSEGYNLENMATAFDSAFHCNQSEQFDFYYNELFPYHDFECIATDPSGFSRKLESSIFIDTYVTENKLFTLAGTDSTSCNAALQTWKTANEVSDAVRFLGIIKGHCVYKIRLHKFMSLPEKVFVSFSHRFSTSTGFGYRGYQTVSFLRDVEQKSIIKEFPDGKDIFGNVDEWLNWAQLDLDKRLNEQDLVMNGGASVDEGIAITARQLLNGLNSSIAQDLPPDTLIYPRLRLTGVTLIVKLQYYNYRLSPIRKGNSNNDKDFHCVVDIEPILSWSSAGSEFHYALRDINDPKFPGSKTPNLTATEHGFYGIDMYRYGIKIVFQSSGILGKFNISELILSITSGLVLLAFATTVVTFLALYCMGLKSKLYRNFIQEKVDYRKEYAKFAAQAVVAAYVFNLMDSDGSGILDGNKMYGVLSALFGHQLTTGQLASLTDFVLRNGDEESDKRRLELFQQQDHKVNLSEQQIDIDEWIQIFASSKASVDSMIHTIESEYKNRKPRFFLCRSLLRRD
eukprot:TRINITY_DN2044_c0_g1_i1.p1 TRINITY_DN2044_c0_g1~~TRINITY_DN2044_c0_g1_i1.p1  ORF type:complete len:586 (-),score=66.17 TRINITY_DN2044_c0_g1_i1:39-1796(-)